MSDFRTMPLPYGLEMIVDADDFAWASQFTWRLNRSNPYPKRAGGVMGKWIFLHRELMVPAPGLVVDHINRNTLDNRRANLRVCTQEDNARNAAYRRGASPYRGACRYGGGRWLAKIRTGGRQISLGVFATDREAAIAYDAAARVHHGEFAYLNFPEAA